MATPRDYLLEYERRRIRAQARGFRSPREETAYKQAAKKYTAAGKRLTVYNYRKAHEAYLRKQKFTKTQKIERAKKAILKDYGITETQFKNIRKENRGYSKNFDDERPFILYNLKIDRRVNDWSDKRVGYILAYNEVFVNYYKVKTLTGEARVKAINRFVELMENYKLAGYEAEAYEYIYKNETIAKAA
jgi:hypothetical protein